MKRIFGIEKNVFFMGLVSFFNDVSSEMIVSIFPAFFASVLKSGAASLGAIEGVADGVSNITKIFSGRLSDRIQKRKSLAAAGYALSVITRPFYLVASAVSHVFAIRVADRLGKGLRDAPRDALISLSAPEGEVGRSFGYHRALDALGSVLGPLAAFFILRAAPQNFNAIFIAAFAIGILAVFSFAFVREVTGVVKSHASINWRTTYPKKFKWFLAALFILSAGSLPVALLLLRTRDLGLDVSFIPLFYLFYNVSYTLFSYAAGRAADRFGERRVIATGYGALAASYLLVIYDRTLFALACGFVILGLFGALTDSTQRSYIARITGEDKRGGAYGLLNAVVGFGALLAGVVGGFLWQSFGASIALATALATIVFGIIIFSLGNEKTR